MELDQAFLDALADVISGVDDPTPENQAKLTQLLEAAEEMPNFVFYIFHLFQNELSDSQKFCLISIFRAKYEFTDPSLEELLISPINDLFIPILYSPMSPLVRGMAYLISCLKNYTRDNEVSLETDVIQMELLSAPETASAGLLFSYYLAGEGYGLNMEVLNAVMATMEIEELRCEALHTMTAFTSLSTPIRERIFPWILENEEQMSADMLLYSVMIASDIAKELKDDEELLSFIITCVGSEDERVSIEAAKFFMVNQMLPLIDEVFIALTDRIVVDDTMVMFNPSVQCFESLRVYIDHGRLERVYPLLQEWFASDNSVDVRKALRTAAALINAINYFGDVDELIAGVVECSDIELIPDVVFFLKEAALVSREHIPEVLELLYSSLESDNENVRAHIFDALKDLLYNSEIPAQPFIRAVLSLFNDMQAQEQNDIWTAAGLFAEAAISFEGEEGAHELITFASEQFVGSEESSIPCYRSLQIISAMLPKLVECAASVVEAAGEKVVSILSQRDDYNMEYFALKFISNVAIVHGGTDNDFSTILAAAAPEVVQALDLYDMPSAGEAYKAASKIFLNSREVFEPFFPTVVQKLAENQITNPYLVAGISEMWIALISQFDASSLQELAPRLADVIQSSIYYSDSIKNTDPIWQTLNRALLITYITFDVNPDEFSITQIRCAREACPGEEWDGLVSTFLERHSDYSSFLL